MKKIGILLMALIFLGIGANAMAEGESSIITGFMQDRTVVTRYNAFGIAFNSLQETTTVTNTKKVNELGEVEGTSEETQTSVVQSSWIAGSLKADIIETTGTTTNSDGSTSSSLVVDDYIYNEAGYLIDVEGGGTSESNDPTTNHRTSGTIEKEYMIRNGQALLLESKSEGTETARNPDTLEWEEVGTFVSKTTIALGDYEYLGGSYVPKKVSSTSVRTGETDEGDISFVEEVSRTTEYDRNSAGVITGIEQTAEGVRVEVTGEATGEVSTQEFEMQDYEADVQFHEQMGWYVAGEKYTWHTEGGSEDPIEPITRPDRPPRVPRIDPGIEIIPKSPYSYWGFGN